MYKPMSPLRGSDYCFVSITSPALTRWATEISPLRGYVNRRSEPNIRRVRRTRRIGDSQQLTGDASTSQRNISMLRSSSGASVASSAANEALPALVRALRPTLRTSSYMPSSSDSQAAERRHLPSPARQRWETNADSKQGEPRSGDIGVTHEGTHERSLRTTIPANAGRWSQRACTNQCRRSAARITVSCRLLPSADALGYGNVAAPRLCEPALRTEQEKRSAIEAHRRLSTIDRRCFNLTEELSTLRSSSGASAISSAANDGLVVRALRPTQAAERRHLRSLARPALG
jgi:hypothetical protein